MKLVKDKMNFILDKVPYPSKKFKTMVDIMGITPEEVLDYFINDDGKYSFDDVESFEEFVFENVLIINGGNEIKVDVTSPFGDEYVIIQLKQAEVDDELVRLLFDVGDVALRTSEDSPLYRDYEEFFDILLDNDPYDVSFSEYLDEELYNKFSNFTEYFGVNFSI
jgi:hypothetical protein